MQAKFGVTDLDTKQRLFRLIKRINADDSSADSTKTSERASASGHALAAYVGSSEQKGHGAAHDVAALTSSLRAMNNNLLDLDGDDSSDSFLTGVRPSRHPTSKRTTHFPFVARPA